jgi:outer membrane immunogenic protein
MNRTRTLAIAAACLAVSGLAVSGFAARAADMPRAPAVPYYKASEAPFSWTGFYAGINGGYGWGRSNWSDPTLGADSGSFNTSGALLGGQLGYNWQTGSVVFGIETDGDWTNIKGSTAGLGGVCTADGGGLCQTRQNWFGTTRGRVGYAFGRFLPYVTGGAAYGDIKALQTTGNSTQTNLGWTVGGGIEYSLNRNWSAKLEYLHLDLGTATFFSAASAASTLSVPVTTDLVRAGINYHW